MNVTHKERNPKLDSYGNKPSGFERSDFEAVARLVGFDTTKLQHGFNEVYTSSSTGNAFLIWEHMRAKIEGLVRQSVEDAVLAVNNEHQARLDEVVKAAKYAIDMYCEVLDSNDVIMRPNDIANLRENTKAIYNAGVEPDTSYLHIKVPAGLAKITKDLVERFSSEMAKKLYKAELKYGFNKENNWSMDHWKADCLFQFSKHVEKGDPVDVANYAAFMWHHGWSTQIDPEDTTRVKLQMFLDSPNDLSIETQSALKSLLSGSPS